MRFEANATPQILTKTVFRLKVNIREYLRFQNFCDLPAIQLNTSQSISILLVALIVLCPMRCIATGCCGETGTSANSSSPCSSLCCGCESKKSPPDGRQDSPPDSPDSCPCHDCVCNGALTANDFSDDINLIEMVDFVLYRAMPETTVAVSTAPQVDQSSLLFPVGVSPANTRAALCCWIL